MSTLTARLVALAFAAGLMAAGSEASASEVSHLCRTSAHQDGGPASSAPDICAVIETTPADTEPRVLDAAQAVDGLATATEAADFVLLGEIHDNPSHHRLRAQLILAIAARRTRANRRPPGLVLEHIRADQALAVAGFRAVDKVQRRTVDDLFIALDWKNSGWPGEDLFRPMLEAALDAEWPILHGNLTRDGIRAVAKGGVASLDPDEIKRLGLDTDLGENHRNALLDELVASHCGLMARAALTTMADAQRYRDAYMANQLIDAAGTHGSAVLLAGNGHVRADRGVPWHLARMAPEKSVLVVMFAQADAERADPVAYVSRGAAGKPIADYTVVTPRVERPDPCVAMRKRFSAPPKAADPKKE